MDDYKREGVDQASAKTTNSQSHQETKKP